MNRALANVMNISDRISQLEHKLILADAIDSALLGDKGKMRITFCGAISLQALGMLQTCVDQFCTK